MHKPHRQERPWHNYNVKNPVVASAPPRTAMTFVTREIRADSIVFYGEV